MATAGVPYSKTYTSTVSLADAQAQAAADPNYAAEGQAQANALGECPVYGYVNIYNSDNTTTANYTVTINDVPVTLTEDFYLYFNGSYTSPVSVKITPTSGVGNIDHDIYSAPDDAIEIQDSVLYPYDTVFAPGTTYEILVNTDVHNYIEIIKHIPVDVSYSVSYGVNPTTHNGLIFMRNGTEVFRTGSEGAGVLTGVFYKSLSMSRPADTMTVRQFSYGPAFPWEAGSKANLTVTQSLMTPYNQDVTVQTIELQQTSFVVSESDINVISTGSSTAVGYSTKILTTNSDTTLAAVEITDTTEPKLVLNVTDTVNSSSSIYPFNVKVDANTLNAKVINKSSISSIDATLTGAGTVTIAPLGSYTWVGSPKDSLTITIVTGAAP